MTDLTSYPTNDNNAEEPEWSRMVSTWRRNGIHRNVSGKADFAPSADPSGGLRVRIGSGDVIIAGFHAQNDATVTVTLDAADPANARIDRIVLRLDRTVPSAGISIETLVGTPALTPGVPALTDNGILTDIPICQVRVGAAVGTILAANITDERIYSADRLLGTLAPTNIDRKTSSAGTSGIPADATHQHQIDTHELQAASHPAGSILMYGGGAAPNGWLLCQGQAVSRSLYTELFAVIGTIYGAGDGSTTFNVPNLENRFPSAPGFGTRGFLGQTGGADSRTVPLLSHSHGVNDSGHTHQPVRGGIDPYQAVVSSPNVETHYIPANPGGAGNTQVTYSPLYLATTGISIQSAGGAGTMSTVPSYLVLNFIIKAH